MKILIVEDKESLRTMLEWHAGVRSGWQADTWHNGWFIDQWADPRALVELNEIYGGYDAASSREALLASIRLFRWLAQEAATVLGYGYPLRSDRRCMILVQDALRLRLGKFGLTLEPTKTKLVEFGRFAQKHASKRGRNRPETIYFLCLTLYCTRNRK